MEVMKKEYENLCGIYILQAQCYLESGKKETAINCLNHVEDVCDEWEIKFTQPKIYMSIADCYFKCGKNEKCLEILQKGISYYKDWYPMYKKKMIMCYRIDVGQRRYGTKKNYDRILRCCAKCLEFAQGIIDYKVHFTKGVVLIIGLKKNNLEIGLKEYLKSLYVCKTYSKSPMKVELISKAVSHTMVRLGMFDHALMYVTKSFGRLSYVNKAVKGLKNRIFKTDLYWTPTNWNSFH